MILYIKIFLNSFLWQRRLSQMMSKGYFISKIDSRWQWLQQKNTMFIIGVKFDLKFSLSEVKFMRFVITAELSVNRYTGGDDFEKWLFALKIKYFSFITHQTYWYINLIKKITSLKFVFQGKPLDVFCGQGTLRLKAVSNQAFFPFAFAILFSWLSFST